ncbi:patched family domain-containing protein [Ditylenchus destructor]|nr:patched family domain-containing protein [Ditylenchus destructor]
MLPEERIYRSLIAIGFPLLQCGFSTILFVLCLLFIDTYMSEVFVKTMVLVVSLGLLHGLFVVPTMLCALSNVYRLFIKLTKTKSKWVEQIRASIRQKDRIWSSVKRRKQVEAEKNISKVFIRSAST